MPLRMGVLLFYALFVSVLCCIGAITCAWVVRILWRQCIRPLFSREPVYWVDASIVLSDNPATRGSPASPASPAGPSSPASPASPAPKCSTVWRAVRHPDGGTAVGMAPPHFFSGASA